MGIEGHKGFATQGSCHQIHWRFRRPIRDFVLPFCTAWEVNHQQCMRPLQRRRPTHALHSKSWKASNWVLSEKSFPSVANCYVPISIRMHIIYFLYNFHINNPYDKVLPMLNYSRSKWQSTRFSFHLYLALAPPMRPWCGLPLPDWLVLASSFQGSQLDWAPSLQFLPVPSFPDSIAALSHLETNFLWNYYF
jgi:hypothetical protein